MRSSRSNKTYLIVISALMVALSFVLPYFMPTIPLAFSSATLFSHVPIIVAMFVSPFVAFFACAGATLAFMLKLGNPLITARAFSHLFFAVPGAFLIKKGIGTRGFSIAIVAVVLTAVHTIMEIFAVIVMLSIIDPARITLFYIIAEVGITAFIHGLIDYAAALVVYQATARAGILDNKFLFAIDKGRAKRDKHTVNSDNITNTIADTDTNNNGGD